MKHEERKPSLRCAIYTRVSTENGLEQEFNSLDNQREASEAYVKSQAHEGWRLIQIRYDDGGYSGGSMDRPALKALLDDVRARRIDVIVVYKVDRLTRSLADFAKLVELFDEYAVSFISVTQSFNTTTSMGRLTLNMLLSFAQFEREITGERIRDKVAASKRRGIWMGGAVPLGYRVEDRALHVVDDQAAMVRELFRRYLEVGSVVRLKVVLDSENVRLPPRILGTGRKTGGGLISRGHIYHILSNPNYTGRLRHKGQLHDGLHAAIVDQDAWDRAQGQLTDQTQTRSKARSRDTQSFLAGKLYDDRGHKMTPSHAAKGGKRWRYYVSQARLKGRAPEAGSLARVPATEIESQVSDAVIANLRFDRDSIDGRVWRLAVGSSRKVIDSLATKGGPNSERPSDDVVRDAIERVTIAETEIKIQLSGAAITEGADRMLVIPWTRPSPFRRREIIQGEGASASTIRPMRVRARAVFLNALRNAHRWLDELARDSARSVETIAEREGKSERSIRMTLSLAFVAPPIVAAAIEGRLPRGFGVKRLMDLPMIWSEQWIALGLKAPAQS
jgi:site-specific DNA recombinase